MPLPGYGFEMGPPLTRDSITRMANTVEKIMTTLTATETGHDDPDLTDTINDAIDALEDADSALRDIRDALP